MIAFRSCACTEHYYNETLTSEEKRTEPNSILVPAWAWVVTVPPDEEAAGPTEGGTSSPFNSRSDHSCGVSSSSSAAPDRMGMSMVA